MQNVDSLLKDVARGTDLDAAGASLVFEEIIAGRLSPERIREFLIDHSRKGPAVPELVGAASVLRAHATRVPCPAADAIDTCGTGGDGISTFNVSTAAAIVAAAAGAVVAKHGNRSHSRRSGSAECLTALGVRTDLTSEQLGRCLAEVGIAFLHAARLHPAMAIVADIRREIGKATIFNLLGPLANPAGVRRQIIGVPRLELLEIIAPALLELGAVRGLVVHGGGLCDLTITGPSNFVRLDEGRIQKSQIHPADLRLKQAAISELMIDSPQASAAAIQAVLAGEKSARRDHTLLNAGAALWVAGIAEDFADGVARATHAIDSGEAGRKLASLRVFTNQVVS